MDSFIASIIIFGGNFAPRGWAFCNGQVLSIAQNTALFSLLGTTYGGNGQTTFALPDLRGRVPVHSGNSEGTGLSTYDLGQSGGTENTTLTINQLPSHNHNLRATDGEGNTRDPANAVLAKEAAGVTASYKAGTNSNTDMNGTSVGNAGGGQPIDTRQPYLALNYIICLEGIFPSRN